MTMKVLHPSSYNIGNFDVRRTLPDAKRTMVGPFIFVDQFGPANFDVGQGMDVRPHPHINLATVTYLFEGAIDHRDSLGTFATIRPGACNLMTAGRGIVHSERTPPDQRAHGSRISGMQTWLALPEAVEEMEPDFQHIGKDDLPLVEDGQFSARVIIGNLWGKTSPVKQYAETIYADILMNAGASLPIEADADERAVIVAIGEASLDGEALAQHSLYILKPGERMILRAATDARVMLLGGEAFKTPRHLWWNFVSSERERINQAKRDWKAGRFPKVLGEDDEGVALPEIRL